MEISVNIKDDYMKWLHEISKETSIDKEEIIKSSIIKYVQEYKLRKAIKKYIEDSISLGKASEIAGLPKRFFMYKLHEIGIPLNLSESDFIKGMDTLIKTRKLKKSS